MLTRLSCLYTAMPVPPCALLRPEAQDGGTRAAACSAEQPEHPPTQGCNRPLMVTLNDCKAWVDSTNAGAIVDIKCIFFVISCNIDLLKIDNDLPHVKVGPRLFHDLILSG